MKPSTPYPNPQSVFASYHKSMSRCKWLYGSMCVFMLLGASDVAAQKTGPAPNDIHTLYPGTKNEVPKQVLTLANDPQRLYLNRNRVELAGTEAIVVESKASMTYLLSNEDRRYKSAKMLVVRIENTNDTQMHLDESALKGFNNLKYILITSSVPLSSDQAATLFTQTKGSKRSVYFQSLANTEQASLR